MKTALRIAAVIAATALAIVPITADRGEVASHAGGDCWAKCL